jgi:Holliday junction resolvase RusA-like endonuclease
LLIKGVEAIGKARPRLSRYGVYTPKKTTDYEKLIRETFTEQNPKINSNLLDCNIIANIVVGYQVPVSYSKKHKEQVMDKGYPQKPDLDNIAKAILDGLNGVAYTDDKQIVCMTVYKRYAEESFIEVDFTYVTTEELKEQKPMRKKGKK